MSKRQRETAIRKERRQDEVNQLYAKFVYSPPKPLEPRPKPTKLKDIKDFHQLKAVQIEVVYEPPKLAVGEKQPKVCPICHHYQKGPVLVSKKETLPHKCPTNEKGEKIRCTSWTTCPVPWKRKLHPDEIDEKPITKRRIEDRMSLLSKDTLRMEKEIRASKCQVPHSQEFKDMVEEQIKEKGMGDNVLNEIIGVAWRCTYAAEQAISVSAAGEQLLMDKELAKFKQQRKEEMRSVLAESKPRQVLPSQKKNEAVTIVIDDNDDSIVTAIQKLQKELEDRQMAEQRKRRQEKLDKVSQVTDELARGNLSAGLKQHLKRRRTEPVDARFFDSVLLAAK